MLLTINPDGTVTVTDSGQGPYRGADDTLIGVQNNSSVPIPKLSLTGTTQPFGFDGDGLCSGFSGTPAACPFGPTGYEGPGTSFTNIDQTTFNSGDVNFAGGIAPGQSAYFSLEGVVSAQNIVIVPPNQAPVCSAATVASPIWPPNHKLVPLTVKGVTDPDKGDTVTVSVTGVTQDEPLNTTADGNTTPEATIGPSGSVSVRSERQGTGDGRVYVISFTATDNHGARCTGHVSVGVPHDRGGAPAVDSGQAYNSLG